MFHSSVKESYKSYKSVIKPFFSILTMKIETKFIDSTMAEKKKINNIIRGR